MSTPIKREDIRKGDKIRQVTVSEFTSDWDGLADRLGGNSSTYELIERPVVLPDVRGVYSASTTGAPGFRLVEFNRGEWNEVTKGTTDEHGERLATRLAKEGSLTLLRPVAEVAAEVLADVRSHMSARSAFLADIDALDKKWETK